MGIFEFDHAIVRQPSHSVIHGLTSQPGAPPTFEAVAAEHRQYVQALQHCGLQVETLAPLEDFPDSIFVEDPALVFGDAAVLLRPGAPTRLAESQHLAEALRRRFGTVLQMKRGFADGGDMLLTPGGLLIGLSRRTDREGARELAGLLRQIGIESRIAETPQGTLHLKSDCAMLADDLILCTPALAAAAPLGGLRKLLVPQGEERAANSLRLNSTVLVGEHFPATAELLHSEGFTVVRVPVTAIGRLDAGLSCMSLRWKSQSAAR